MRFVKITVCGNFGVTNIGDEAIFSGLKSLLLEAFPESEIMVQGKGNLFPFGVRSFLKSFVNPSLLKTPINLVKASDLYILGGGGLFDDTEGPFISSFWALQGLTAAQRLTTTTHTSKKPLVIMGVSLGKINFWNKFFVQHLFKKARAVSVRDQASKDLIQQWGIQNVLVVPDLALFYPLSEYERKHLNRGDPYVILSVRPFRNATAKLYTNLAQLCDYIVDRYGFSIRLIPFQKDIYSDARILNKIFEQATRKEKIIREQFSGDIPGLLEVFRKAEAVIGMRFHAGIFSLLSEVPFLGLSYLNKVDNFWKTIDYPNIVTLQEACFEELKRKIDMIVENKHFYKEKLKQCKDNFLSQKSAVVAFLKDAYYP